MRARSFDRLGRLGLLGLLLAPGCIRLGKPPTAPVWPVAAKSVRVGSIDVEVEVGWMPVGARQITLLVTVFNTSVLRSDDLAVDIGADGFVVAEGRPRWSGLVPIRSKIYQEVTYTMRDDVAGGHVTIGVRRSRSRMPFWSAELRFGKSDRGVRLVSSSAPR